MTREHRSVRHGSRLIGPSAGVWGLRGEARRVPAERGRTRMAHLGAVPSAPPVVRGRTGQTPDAGSLPRPLVADGFPSGAIRIRTGRLARSVPDTRLPNLPPTAKLAECHASASVLSRGRLSLPSLTGSLRCLSTTPPRGPLAGASPCRNSRRRDCLLWIERRWQQP